ncbi:hypothetical protein TYRP_000894 [Tyrophagus putrescentiae]|nr:hypothetical protein TYRP_000894 [Tyrophagus putrescentiae]
MTTDERAPARDGQETVTRSKVDKFQRFISANKCVSGWYGCSELCLAGQKLGASRRHSLDDSQKLNV